VKPRSNVAPPVVLLSVVLMACSGTSGPTTSATTSTAPTVAQTTTQSANDDASALVARACLDSTDEHCADTMRDALRYFESGSLVAVCDYLDGTGDVVLLDDEDEAESACSFDGLILPSRVVTVVELP
jgi:hypothetical protein